jgi:hypothetical protein
MPAALLSKGAYQDPARGEQNAPSLPPAAGPQAPEPAASRSSTSNTKVKPTASAAAPIQVANPSLAIASVG